MNELTELIHFRETKDEEMKRISKAIKEHGRELKILPDQTEEGPGNFYFSRNPTLRQQQIEQIVTNNRGYLDSHSFNAPRKSIDATDYFHSRKYIQQNPEWTDEEYETEFGDVRSISNLGLQVHLLEMEQRTASKSRLKALKAIQKKYEKFTELNEAAYYSAHPGSQHNDRVMDLLEDLQELSTEKAIKFFTVTLKKSRNFEQLAEKFYQNEQQ